MTVDFGDGVRDAGMFLYGYIENSSLSKPFHHALEKGVKKVIGEFKNPAMDAVSGRWHRWAHGHDLWDVITAPQTSWLDKKNGVGHLLTDLFTKDGLPIPGFGKSNLGYDVAAYLERLGVESPIKWLNMNGFDYLFGGWSMIDATGELHTALATDMGADFTADTAIETFGEGAYDIAFGVATENPFALVAGIEEFVAGGILLYKDYAASFSEKLLYHLPSSSLLLSSLGLYLLVHSLRNYIAYTNGAFTKKELISKTVVDVAVSLASFTVTKSFVGALSLTALGPMMPLVVGVLSSMFFRKLVDMTSSNQFVPDKQTLIETPAWRWNVPFNASVVGMSHQDEFSPKQLELWSKPLWE